MGILDNFFHSKHCNIVSVILKNTDMQNLGFDRLKFLQNYNF